MSTLPATVLSRGKHSSSKPSRSTSKRRSKAKRSAAKQESNSNIAKQERVSPRNSRNSAKAKRALSPEEQLLHKLRKHANEVSSGVLRPVLAQEAVRLASKLINEHIGFAIKQNVPTRAWNVVRHVVSAQRREASLAHEALMRDPTNLELQERCRSVLARLSALFSEYTRDFLQWVRLLSTRLSELQKRESDAAAATVTPVLLVEQVPHAVSEQQLRLFFESVVGPHILRIELDRDEAIAKLHMSGPGHAATLLGRRTYHMGDSDLLLRDDPTAARKLAKLRTEVLRTQRSLAFVFVSCGDVQRYVQRLKLQERDVALQGLLEAKRSALASRDAALKFAEEETQRFEESARNSEQHAARCYERAQQHAPNLGKVYNQVATMRLQSNDLFSAMFECMRALCAVDAYPAETNLSFVFDRATKLNDAKPSANASEFDLFASQFVDILGRLITKVRVDQLREPRVNALKHWNNLCASERLTPVLPVRVLFALFVTCDRVFGISRVYACALASPEIPSHAADEQPRGEDPPPRVAESLRLLTECAASLLRGAIEQKRFAMPALAFFCRVLNSRIVKENGDSLTKTEGTRERPIEKESPRRYLTGGVMVSATSKSFVTLLARFANLFCLVDRGAAADGDITDGVTAEDVALLQQQLVGMRLLGQHDAASLTSASWWNRGMRDCIQRIVQVRDGRFVPQLRDNFVAVPDGELTKFLEKEQAAQPPSEALDQLFQEVVETPGPGQSFLAPVYVDQKKSRAHKISTSDMRKAAEERGQEISICPYKDQKPRVIVLDVPNIALRYGRRQKWDPQGVAIAAGYFEKHGCRVVGFLPDLYFDRKWLGRRRAQPGGKPLPSPKDVSILCRMRNEQLLFGTPQNDYDDAYMLEYARRHDGAVIVSNDRYRDYYLELHGAGVIVDTEKQMWVQEHVLHFTFVAEEFIPNPQFQWPPMAPPTPSAADADEVEAAEAQLMTLTQFNEANEANEATGVGRGRAQASVLFDSKPSDDDDVSSAAADDDENEDADEEEELFAWQ